MRSVALPAPAVPQQVIHSSGGLRGFFNSRWAAPYKAVELTSISSTALLPRRQPFEWEVRLVGLSHDSCKYLHPIVPGVSHINDVSDGVHGDAIGGLELTCAEFRLEFAIL